jgi:hypothetical protein
MFPTICRFRSVATVVQVVLRVRTAAATAEVQAVVVVVAAAVGAISIE